MKDRFVILRNTKVKSKYDVIEVDYQHENVKFVEKELSFEQAVAVVESYQQDELTWES